MIDSQDRDRIHEARIELHRILTARELTDAIVLVFANKQDLSQSMGEREVQERLQLEKFPGRVWKVQASCATSGEGLVEGLNWLAENIKSPPSKRADAAASASDAAINAQPGHEGSPRQLSGSGTPPAADLAQGEPSSSALEDR